MKGYLAGPMRGYVDSNFPAFDRAAAHLRAEGHKVINPAEHDREMGFNGSAVEVQTADFRRKAIMWDLHAIARSECVWVLPGFRLSLGCTVELALARFLGLPIIKLGKGYTQ